MNNTFRLLWCTVLLFFLATVKAQNGTSHFPRILWTYWDKGFEGMTMITKMCVNNMAHFANQTGWEFRFLTDQNISQYISIGGMERLMKMWGHSVHPLQFQHKADIVRLILIYEQGGMWVDTNSVFLGPLSWLDDYASSPYLYNRLSPTPDIITFTLSFMGGNKTETLHPTLGNVEIFPGVEIWSFVAVPGCLFLKDTLENLEHSLATDRSVLDRQSESWNILFGWEVDPYYITSNYQFQTVLQRKQRQLQRGQRGGYAVEYYKMWSIRSEESSYAVISGLDWFPYATIFYLATHNLEQAKERFNMPAYFIKFNGQTYNHLNFFLTNTHLLYCLGFEVALQPNSILQRYLIDLNRDLPDLQFYLDLQHSGKLQDEECHHIDPLVRSMLSSIVNWTALVGIGLMAGMLGVGLWVVRRVRAKNRKQYYSY